MADPRQSTVARHASIKIRAGSALDRLTVGQSFTDVVHEVFEMYARAIGDPTPELVEPTAPQEPKAEPEETQVVSFGGNSRDTHRSPEDHQRVPDAVLVPYTTGPAGSGIDMAMMRFEVPDPESGLLVEVGYDDAMRMLKEQCPAGLEPVLDQFMIAREEGRDTVAQVVPKVDDPEQEPFDYEQLA